MRSGPQFLNKTIITTRIKNNNNSNNTIAGAEIEGLVRAAQSSAMNRLVKPGGKVRLR